MDQEYKRVDAEMRSKYERLLGELSKPENDAVDVKNLLVAAQRSWRLYRDNQCRAFTSLVRGNTDPSRWRSSCLARLTKARLSELRELDDVLR